MTRLGGVGDLMAGPVIEAGDSGYGIGTSSSGPLVEDMVVESSRIEVGAEELMVLSGWGSRSILLLATRVSDKLDLRVNCRFASTPDR